MTLQNLSKILDKYEQQLGSGSIQQFELLKDLPFYNWPTVGQFSTTFNHAIGLPRKNGQLFPLFDYEQMLFDTLQNNKHVWIKKATGLGITEFMLRYMAWLCLKDDTYRGAQMPIVCGPNQDIAIKLIKRIKGLFEPLGILFDTKETVVELNGCTIEAYPSNHLDAYRSLERPKFIFLDEADFFPPGQQQDARDVAERYIAKSNPWIVTVSTPNAPEGLFERIEREPESTCLYHRLFLDYTYGLGKIYTAEEIQAAKASPSFEREYNLKYLGLIGNVFHTKDIDAAIEKGRRLEIQGSVYTQKSIGLDPGFGSSAFGVCITELVDGVINVVHAEEYVRPDFNQIINITLRLLDEYNITFEGHSRIFVDGANPSFIKVLKECLNEDAHYQKQMEYLKTQYKEVYDMQSLTQNMFVVPVYFSKEHKSMLAHCKQLMEYESGHLAIHPRHNKLITALRTAVENGEGVLDKDATSHDDLFDSFRLSLQFWH
jgi:hypothetical protein